MQEKQLRSFKKKLSIQDFGIPNGPHSKALAFLFFAYFPFKSLQESQKAEIKSQKYPFLQSLHVLLALHYSQFTSHFSQILNSFRKDPGIQSKQVAVIVSYLSHQY